MTGISKTLLMLGSWLLFAVIWWFLALKDCCPETDGAAITNIADTTNVAQPAAPVLNAPLGFLWDSEVAHKGPGFQAFKDSILAGMTDNNILEFVGYYYEGEKAMVGDNEEESTSLGLARAQALQALFAEVPEDRTTYAARSIDKEDEGVRTNYFAAHAFNWQEAEESKAVANTVEELDDRIIIRFPFGSAVKEYNKEVDEYLKKLSARVIETNENITLTGHTDNKGSNEDNLKLGQDRADGIKAILVKDGVDAALITTSSKGETQPIRSNNTDAGRYENRRVEVRLIKKEEN